MSIWFVVLWLFLSATLLFFLGWTLFILFRQKATWKAFAVKNKLRFRSSSLLAAPEMGGAISGRTFNFFIAEHLTADMRSSRKLSAVELRLGGKVPFDAGVASGGMVQLVQSLGLRDEFRPNHPKWDKNYIAAASSTVALESYLTPERLDALTSLMKIRNAWVILIFRGDTMLLRFDTPDPLDTPDKLNKITQKMVEVAGILDLKAGEDSRLKADAAKRPVKEKSLSVDDRDFNEAKAFQLEEEHKPAQPPEEKENP